MNDLFKYRATWSAHGIMNPKSITILFPIHGLEPRGGQKVAYEYANRLSKDGYIVHIVYPALPYIGKHSMGYRARMIIKYFFYRFIKGYSCRDWFNLDEKIVEHYVYSLNYSYVPKTDYYIATAVETALYVKTYNVSMKKIIYLIQGYEVWAASVDLLRETYNYGFNNIVVSDWLAEIVRSSGADCTLIKNGFDFNYFKLTVPFHCRNKFRIAMMYSTQQCKGVEWGFAALSIVKKKYTDLRVSLFGVHEKPQQLPNYFDYYQRPDRETHNRIYNEAAIFLAPSIEEGWGLPMGEAMICGCAIVCTDNKGFREMAEDGVSALMSPVRDAESLAKNIIRLIENEELRIMIAERGHKEIQHFTWEKSYQKMKTLLK